MKKPKIICYVAGKSGGHIIPCLTLAEEEKQKHPETDILFFTSSAPLDIEIINNNAHLIARHIILPLNAITSGWNIFRTVWQACISVFKIGYTLIRYRPDTVICTGGFLAVPVSLFARLLAIPVIAYELNVQPGKATRLIAYWATQLAICFSETQHYFPKKRCHKVAYPIRFFTSRQQICQKEALKELQLSTDRKTIFILGGSQGSLQINNLMHDWLLAHPNLYNSIQVIHQIGRKETFDWHTFYRERSIPARVFSFSLDMALHYSAADLIICRSGAGTLFETLFFSKRCITIPLETSHNKHQVANAKAMQQSYDDLFTMIRTKQLLISKEPFYHAIDQALQINVMPQEMQQQELYSQSFETKDSPTLP